MRAAARRRHDPVRYMAAAHSLAAVHIPAAAGADSPVAAADIGRWDCRRRVAEEVPVPAQDFDPLTGRPADFPAAVAESGRSAHREADLPDPTGRCCRVWAAAAACRGPAADWDRW